MNHQITLEELGLIPKQEVAQKKEYAEPSKQYVSPCGGCICNHCANSVECWDNCTGEMETPCFVCDECIYYDGQGKNQKREECRNYKVTNKYAEYLRKGIRTVRNQ
ncbi:MAG: hypothetical protein NC548_63765 [Lachnospiraceae bacterium]|nr:hypothetical protein [Lachnospiraceae bacterium]